jgi:hypothetical protein
MLSLYWKAYPITSKAAQLARFGDKNDRRVGLIQEEQRQYSTGKGHERWDVLCPSPAKVALCDEASNPGGRSQQGGYLSTETASYLHGTGQWTVEHRGSESGDRHTSRFIVEDIGEDRGNDGEGARSKESSEKATNQKRLDVF